MANNDRGMKSKLPGKFESSDSDFKLAVLIDADNAQASIVRSLLAEIAKFGVASVKRIYGDWTQPQLGSWKKVLLELSIQPVQQFGYTKGKNATDSALIIDAMDLLYTRRFDGFCLVSSDSDFTRLAARLREEGLIVYGFGERKTPEPFVSACDKFIYTELLQPIEALKVDSTLPDAAKVTSSEQVPIELIVKAVDDVSEDNGWAQLGTVGSNITKVRPEFDSRLYGYKKFSNLVKSFPAYFEIQERASGAEGVKDIYIRNKNYRSTK
jgi:uncharacterized LabA/DUF88 family protein